MANQHLSKYSEMASHGSEIIVTKRGRPVARIAPIEVGGLMSDAEKYRIVRRGTDIIIRPLLKGARYAQHVSDAEGGKSSSSRQIRCARLGGDL